MTDPSPQPLRYAAPAELHEGALVIRTSRTSAIIFVVWGSIFVTLALTFFDPRFDGGYSIFGGAGLAMATLGVWRLIQRVPRLILTRDSLISAPYRLDIL